MRIEDSRIIKQDNVTFRELDGEAVLYDNVSKNMNILNKTALEIWRLCDTEEDMEGIVRAIASKFSLPEEDIRHDVASCLNKFIELGIVRRSI